MAYKAKIKNEKTGEIGKELIDAIEAKELESDYVYVCPGRVAGKPCLACFGRKACAKESKKNIKAHYSTRAGGGEHIPACIYDKSNKNSIWKGIATKNASVVDIAKIINSLEEATTPKKKLEQAEKNVISKKEIILSFVPSEYKDPETNQLKESYDIKTNWTDGKLAVEIYDKEDQEDNLWSNIITEDEIKETIAEHKKKPNEEKKKTTREHNQINKNILQLYLLAITADENTTFLDGKKVFDCCLNCLTYRDFRIGKNELHGPGLFIAKRFNFSQSWALEPVKEFCKQRNMGNYAILSDAFVPKETNLGYKSAEDLPVISILDCADSLVRTKIVNKIRNGEYFAIGCNWETVSLYSDDGNLRKIVIGHLCSEKQLEILEGDLNLEDKNSLS